MLLKPCRDLSQIKLTDLYFNINFRIINKVDENKNFLVTEGGNIFMYRCMYVRITFLLNILVLCVTFVFSVNRMVGFY